MAGSRVYVETTVLSYLTAREPRDPIIAAHYHVTREWWDRDRSRHELVISAVVTREAGAGDPTMAAKRLALAADMSLIAITPAVESLAASLLARDFVPRTVPDDALHIAVATLGEADYLLTWNLRHLAGAVSRRRIEQELRRLGYQPPTICTPEELKASYD
jgi:predicted nucleic acid-binding protein